MAKDEITTLGHVRRTHEERIEDFRALRASRKEGDNNIESVSKAPQTPPALTKPAEEIEAYPIDSDGTVSETPTIFKGVATKAGFAPEYILDHYDHFSEKNIYQAAEQLNPRRVSDIGRWGRALQDESAAAIRQEKRALLIEKKKAVAELRGATGRIVECLNDINDNTGGFFARNLNWVTRVLTGNRNVTPVFEIVLDSLEELKQAVDSDAQNCLDTMTKAENSKEAVAKFGKPLRLHSEALQAIRKNQIAETTGLVPAEDAVEAVLKAEPHRVRDNLQERIDDLDNSYDVWQGAIKGFDSTVTWLELEMDKIKMLGREIDTAIRADIDAATLIEEEMRDLTLSKLSKAARKEKLNSLNEQMGTIAESIKTKVAQFEDVCTAIEEDITCIENDKEPVKLIEHKVELAMPLIPSPEAFAVIDHAKQPS